LSDGKKEEQKVFPSFGNSPVLIDWNNITDGGRRRRRG
jgi:hypothetical protein